VVEEEVIISFHYTFIRRKKGICELVTHTDDRAERTSETSVHFCEVTRRYIPEGSNIRTKSCSLMVISNERFMASVCSFVSPRRRP
jgi:hypothetical protein